MRIDQEFRHPTVFKALVIYFSAIFSWHFVFDLLLPGYDNVYFLIWPAATVSIYWIAKSSLKPHVLGPSLRFSDTAEIALLFIAAVLTGIGCWALLVFCDAAVNGEAAIDHWRLISPEAFNKLEWSFPWLVCDLLTASVLGPLIEELVFRGWILGRLCERHSPGRSVLISAALFAAFHVQTSFLGTFVHGVIFAVLVIRTSSIYSAILVHGLYNATISALKGVFGFSLVADANMLSSLTYWAPELLCGLAGFALLAVYFLVSPIGHCDRKRAL